MATVRSQMDNFEIEEFFRSLTTSLTSFKDNVSFDSAKYIIISASGHMHETSQKSVINHPLYLNSIILTHFNLIYTL